MSKKSVAAIIITGCFLLGSFSSFSQEGGDYIVHTIKSGEVPAVLAKKYNVTLADLTSLNKWGPKVILHVGDKVKLPVGAHLSTTADSSAKTAVVVKAPAVATPAVTSTPVDAPEGKSAAAQVQPKLVIKPMPDTGRFTIHVIQHGEIPSVLAKKYHVNVDELKELNNWTVKTVWHVGEKVKLPRATDAAPVADSAKVAQAVTKPVTPAVVVSKPVVDTTAKIATVATAPGQVNYVVKKKETLYSIAKKNKVTVAQLKDWNRLLDDKLTDGQTLVLFPDKTVAQPVVEAKNAPPVVVVKETAPPVVAPQPPPAVTAKPHVDTVAAIPPEGYFSSLFGQDIAGKTLKSANGIAMTFKTASGWTDKKYYILMNEAPPGSIVKITNADGKYVFGKILWNMGDPQDNEGLNFRISDAAASALGIKDMKFQVTVDYYK